MEKAFFFQNKGVNLFAMLYVPDNENDKKDIGVVVCGSLYEERLRNHRVLVNWSRFLAKKGYSVLLFDYRGDGDSDGDYEDYTIETRIDDIVRAVDEMTSQTGGYRIVLHGLRYGASLAYAAALRLIDIDALMLWAPVVDLQSELNQLLRTNITTQMMVYKKVVAKIEDLIAGLKEGKNVNVEGYQLNEDFYRQAAHYDLLDLAIPLCKKSLIVGMSRKPEIPDVKLEALCQKIGRSPAQCNIVKLGQEIDWKGMRTYSVNPVNLFRISSEWLEGALSQDPHTETTDFGGIS